MAKRKSYSEEFKREAVRLLLTRGERPVAEVAKGLGVSSSQLYQWQRRYADVAATAVNGRGESKDEELARLRRESVDSPKGEGSPKKVHWALRQRHRTMSPNELVDLGTDILPVARVCEASRCAALEFLRAPLAAAVATRVGQRDSPAHTFAPSSNAATAATEVHESRERCASKTCT